MRDQVETNLVERLRVQDESALAELSAVYGAKIFQLAFRYVKNREDAEDQTLKSRLHRGRLLLRERLSDFAGGLSLHRPAEAF